jgi:tetratricopeptide (TPR) repeat protein
MERKEGDSPLERANRLLETGRPKEALELLDGVDQSALDDEARIEWACLRGWALSDLDRHEAAVEFLDELAEAHPDSSRLLCTLGIVLSNAGELEGAVDALEEALEVDAADDIAVANLALVYEKLREYERALELYDKALELGAEVDWVLLRKSSVLTECGEFDDAKKTIKRYLSLAPEDVSQWVSLGILHSDDDEYDEAFACYAEAEKLAADDASLRLNWGVTAVRARDLRLAREQLARLRKIEPDSTRWQLLEAFIFEEDGRVADAKRVYDRVLRRRAFGDRTELMYALEMAMDFFARHKLRPRCAELVERAYAENACTVELCEAYREAWGQFVKRAYWYSIVLEADYRTGLHEIGRRSGERRGRLTRFARDYQVVARNHDEAVGMVLEFARRMGERHATVREFIGQEPIEKTYTGIYEVEPESFVFAPDGENGEPPAQS